MWRRSDLMWRDLSMRIWFSSLMMAVIVGIGVLLVALSVSGQTAAYRAPRTPDGKPNLNGIWQALNSADWDLQGHTAAKGPLPSLGAVFAIPAGLSVVEGDEI